MESVRTTAGPDQKAVLQQVDQFWSMLDDMSLNDPERYRTFMQRHLTEGAGYFTPPQPYSCLSAFILEPDEGLLYINVCRWKRVPVPRSRSHPIPICGGKLQAVVEGNEAYSVLDVAFSPEVLHKAQDDPEEKEQLHLLALAFAQQQHGLGLSQHYTVANTSLKGSVEGMVLRLSQPGQPTASGPGLLQQISSLREGQVESGGTLIQLTPEQGEKQEKADLIQVISSTEFTRPQRPKHEFSFTKAGASRNLRLTVELPGVRSVSECQLSISQDDVLVEVEDVYHLLLKLPETVNQEEASAIFSRKTQTLLVTVPVL